VTQRKLRERKIAAVMKRAERVFAHDGVVVVPRVIVSAVEDCWTVLDDGDQPLDALVIAVAIEAKRFKADPSGYLAWQQGLVAA
jgi:hypothetical protein